MARPDKNLRRGASPGGLSFGGKVALTARSARSLRYARAYRRVLSVEALECRWALSVSPVSYDAADLEKVEKALGETPAILEGYVAAPTLLDEHDDAVRFDAGGNKFYADPVFDESLLGVVAAASEDAPPFPLEDTFALHSNPGATKVIYLDFDGHTTTGTLWNQSYGASIVTPAYSFEGGSEFSAGELERIQRVWERVTEDFLPFNVDVTTEDPGVAALTNSGGGDTQWGVRVVIGANTWYGNAGGVAYVGSFSWNSDTPVFVFNSGETSIVEAASHEVGHALGLDHDGRVTPAEGYYQGHGSGDTSWAPIMGVGYYVSLTQWSRGEYPSANNTQDDLAIIAGSSNGFGYRADDHAGSLAGATPLVSSNSELIATSGIIERTSDQDYFVFNTTGGAIDIDVSPFYRSPNLDILLSLYDSVGALIVSSNPASLLSASLVTSLAAGTYYLSVDGVGRSGDGAAGPDYGYSDYASLGYYSITGSIGAPAYPVVTVAPLTTKDTTPAIHGTINDIAATITVDVGGQLGLSAVNNGDGTWTLPDNLVAALSEGVYDVVARAVNPALVEAFDATTDELVIDLTPPVVTVDPLTTTNRSPALTGTVNDPAASVFVTIGAQAGLAAINNGNGTWTLPAGTLSTLGGGVYDVQATAVDPAQNSGVDSTTGELTVNVPPAVTVGVLLTSDATPDLFGTVDDPAATLVVDVAGQVGLPAINNGDGTWTLLGSSLAPIASGVYEVVVTATNSNSISGQDATSAELTVQAGAGPFTVTHSRAIALPGVGTSGVGGVYPSTIHVAGMTDDVLRVRVTLNDLSHTYLDDLDILLVGPGGTAVMLMSDAGGSNDAVNLDVTFDDAAPSVVPDTGALSSGAYRPGNYGGSETLPAPAPSLPYYTLLNALTGIDPNGAWSLYAVDDAGSDLGAIAGGWTLSLEVGVDVTPPTVTVDPLTTSDTTPTLTGRVNDPRATVVVTVADQSGLVATNNGDGTWTLNGALLDALPLGTYDVSVVATDPTGNSGSDHTADELLVTTDSSENLFTNSATILLPGTGTGGVADAYPSVITVAGVTTAPVGVRVTLHGLTHSYPDDLDILLVGPHGQTVILMSDAGGSNDATGVELVFDDSASVDIPGSGTLTSGTFRPMDYEAGESLPAPAPIGPYGATLSVFQGIDPNGEWTLYVNDDATGDSGLLSGGWSIELLSASADDHGNSSGSATYVPAPSVTGGVLEVAGDVDYFAFNAVAGADYDFSTVLATLEDSTLTLYGTDGVTELDFDDDGGDGLASRIEWTAPLSGVYYLAVRAYDNDSAGGYALHIETNAATDDHGNTYDTATLVVTPSTTSGILELIDDVDYFTFTTVKGDLYRLSTTLLSLEDSTLALYDVDGVTEINFDDDSGVGLGSAIVWQAPASGVYYAAVRSFDASYLGEYVFGIVSDDTPGDYNGDLVVDAADYTAYCDTLGQTVPAPFDGADGNGDGVVTTADYDYWRNNYGASYLPESFVKDAKPAASTTSEEAASPVTRLLTPPSVGVPSVRGLNSAGLSDAFTERDAVFVDYPSPGVSPQAAAIRLESPTVSTVDRDHALRLLVAPRVARSEAALEGDVSCAIDRGDQHARSTDENRQGVLPGVASWVTHRSAS